MSTQMKEMVKYLRELSVIVVGIAITVSIGILVNKKDNEKDLKMYLDAIKLELEQNIKEFDNLIELDRKSIGYADYLKNNDKKSLNRDSIISYMDAFYQIITVTYKTSAFEMFKLSGAMRLMNDKDLLLSIWDTYTHIDEIKTLLEWGFQLKSEEIKKELSMIGAGNTDFIPMQTFYTVTDWAYNLPNLCNQATELLKETVTKLEEWKKPK